MGHIILQNDRSFVITNKMTIRNTRILTIKGTRAGISPRMSAQGTADCNVAGGQILQKKRSESVPRKKGTTITDTMSIRYFNFSKCFEIFILGVVSL